MRGAFLHAAAQEESPQQRQRQRASAQAEQPAQASFVKPRAGFQHRHVARLPQEQGEGLRPSAEAALFAGAQFADAGEREFAARFEVFFPRADVIARRDGGEIHFAAAEKQLRQTALALHGAESAGHAHQALVAVREGFALENFPGCERHWLHRAALRHHAHERILQARRVAVEAGKSDGFDFVPELPLRRRDHIHPHAGRAVLQHQSLASAPPCYDTAEPDPLRVQSLRAIAHECFGCDERCSERVRRGSARHLNIVHAVHEQPHVRELTPLIGPRETHAAQRDGRIDQPRRITVGKTQHPRIKLPRRRGDAQDEPGRLKRVIAHRAAHHAARFDVASVELPGAQIIRADRGRGGQLAGPHSLDANSLHARREAFRDGRSFHLQHIAGLPGARGLQRLPADEDAGRLILKDEVVVADALVIGDHPAQPHERHFRQLLGRQGQHVGHVGERLGRDQARATQEQRDRQRHGPFRHARRLASLGRNANPASRPTTTRTGM